MEKGGRENKQRVSSRSTRGNSERKGGKGERQKRSWGKKGRRGEGETFLFPGFRSGGRKTYVQGGKGKINRRDIPKGGKDTAPKKKEGKESRGTLTTFVNIDGGGGENSKRKRRQRWGGKGKKERGKPWDGLFLPHPTAKEHKKNRCLLKGGKGRGKEKKEVSVDHRAIQFTTTA